MSGTFPPIRPVDGGSRSRSARRRARPSKVTSYGMRSAAASREVSGHECSNRYMELPQRWISIRTIKRSATYPLREYCTSSCTAAQKGTMRWSVPVHQCGHEAKHRTTSLLHGEVTEASRLVSSLQHHHSTPKRRSNPANQTSGRLDTMSNC